MRDKNSSYVYLIFASLFSLILAYTFGNEGYEAFITVAIALGLLISWQLLNLIRLLFQTKAWLIVKLFGVLLLSFCWFVAIAAVMLSISRNAFDPLIAPPRVNWILVFIGTLPFLLPRVNSYSLPVGASKTIAGVLTSLYSIMVLYVAIIGYYDGTTKYRSLLLVLAAQLQYMMSHAITKTNYLNQSHAFALNLTKQLKISTSKAGQYLIIFVVGLPFILPLAMVTLVSSFH